MSIYRVTTIKDGKVLYQAAQNFFITHYALGKTDIQLMEV